MKILHLQTGSASTGGVSNYVSNIVTGLQQRKITWYVSVLKGEKYKDKTARLYANAELVELFESDFFSSYVKGIFKLIGFVNNNDVKLIHCHCLKSGLLVVAVKFFIPRVKVIYTNHGLRYTLEKNYISWFMYYFLELLVLSITNKYISIRETDYNISRKWRYFSSKLMKIKTFRPDLDYTRIRNYFTNVSIDSTVNFCFVGSLIEIKNPFKFLSWMNYLAKNASVPIYAHVFGDGPLRQELECFVADANINIKFHGEVNRCEIIDFYKNNKITYLCLTSNIDTLPFAVIEAYSCGVPIITNSRPGLEDYFAHQVTGFRVDNEIDLEDLSGMMNNEHQYDMLCKTTLEYCEMNIPSKNVWLASYFTLYKSLIYIEDE